MALAVVPHTSKLCKTKAIDIQNNKTYINTTEQTLLQLVCGGTIYLYTFTAHQQPQEVIKCWLGQDKQKQGEKGTRVLCVSLRKNSQLIAETFLPICALSSLIYDHGVRGKTTFVPLSVDKHILQT